MLERWDEIVKELQQQLNHLRDISRGNLSRRTRTSSSLGLPQPPAKRVHSGSLLSADQNFRGLRRVLRYLTPT